MARALIVSLLLFAATGIGIDLACAQQSKPVPRIAYVYLYRIGPTAPFVDAFGTRLRELGWINGKTIDVTYRDADGSPEKLAAIMRELVDSKIDLIVSVCTPETMAARKVTSTIPIVVAASGDLLATGLIASYARPGGNVTGNSGLVLEQSVKRMEILKEAFPAVRQATVVWNPARPDNKVEVAAMQSAARNKGVRLDSQQVRDRDEMDVALDAMAKERIQALTETGDPFLYDQAQRLVEFAAKMRIPAIYDNRAFVDAGGLMSFGVNLPKQHALAADYVDKILKGAKPGELAIWQPSEYELVINMKTAKSLGIDIPQSLLVRANDVIR